MRSPMTASTAKGSSRDVAAILTANAGQQWDGDVVRHLMLVVADSNVLATLPNVELKVPDDLAELLVRVDCEI